LIYKQSPVIRTGQILRCCCPYKNAGTLSRKIVKGYKQ
jgi:hypothetical protein